MTWQRAAELLEERQYEQVAQLLQERQETVQRSGQMAVAIFLAAACQICLTCQQYQVERELHRRALEDSDRRERELRSQLSAIINVLSGDRAATSLSLDQSSAESVSILQEASASRTDQPESLLEKLQSRLGLRSSHSDIVSEQPIEAETKKSTPESEDEKEPQSPDTPQIESSEAKPRSSFDVSFPNAEQLSVVDQELMSLIGQKLAVDPLEDGGDSSEHPAEPHTESPAQDRIDLSAESTTSPGQQSSDLATSSHTRQRSESTENKLEPDDGPLPATEDHIRPEKTANHRSAQSLLPNAGDQGSLTPLRSNQIDPDAPTLAVYCLGLFQVYVDDRLVEDWPSGKGKSIFKYLVNNRQHPAPKEMLMDLFWPDADPDSARNNLNVAIYGLRQALRNVGSDFPHVLFRNDSYLLNPDLSIWLDVEEFTRLFNLAKQLERDGLLKDGIKAFHTAEVLYQGEFLAEDRYEEWLIPIRQQLNSMYFELLERLNQYYYEQEDYASSMNICRSMLRIDPCSEVTHRRLMLCYYRHGQQHLALRQYHHCVKALKDELDVAPAPETTELCERIRRHEPL